MMNDPYKFRMHRVSGGSSSDVLRSFVRSPVGDPRCALGYAATGNSDILLPRIFLSNSWTKLRVSATCRSVAGGRSYLNDLPTSD